MTLDPSASAQRTSVACGQLLQIANDRSCAEATRELARLGLTGYLSSILGEPLVIEDNGACD